MSDLRLLPDIPAGILEPDRFEHSVYADVLADLFRSSRPAISVGLFGKWGQGKSSVVNLLKQKFDREQKTEGMRKYKVVIFNAWKSRGDHVRRQMLMEVLRQIDSPQYKNMRKFTQTLLPFDMWQSDEQVEYSENRRWWQALVNERLPGWVICIAVVSVCLFVTTVLLIRGLWVGQPSSLRIARALTVLCAWLFGCIITIAGWLRATSNRLLAYTEPVSNSQKLKYPEQFQQVFEDEVIKYCRKNGNLVLVVDDLDRCDPKTVVEALAAIRQFTKVDESIDPNFYCQFLVPCDERQVILALEADGYTSRHDHERYHDYQSEELLRKFFDITLRMHDFLSDDLGDYAEKLAGDIGLSGQEAREIVALTNATTPKTCQETAQFPTPFSRSYRACAKPINPTVAAIN